MESIQKYLAGIMETPGASWIVAIFGLLVCILVSLYVVKAFRDLALGRTDTPASHLSEFENMRAEGKINQEEYHRLKKTLPDHLGSKEITGRSDKKE